MPPQASWSLRRISVVLLCLLCISHSRHKSNSQPELQPQGRIGKVEEFSPLKVFAVLLLAFNRTLGWQIPVEWHGHNFYRSSPKCKSARPRSVGLIQQSSGYGNKLSDIRKERDVRRFEQALNLLQADIPSILRKEPHWDLFAEDFKVIDQTGATLEGLGPSRLLLKRLRRICKRFAVRDDIQAHCIQVLKGPVLGAQWNIRFGRFHHELKTSFYFSDESKVGRIQIDSWSVNGMLFQLPIRYWARDFKELQPLDISLPVKDSIDNSLSSRETAQRGGLQEFENVVDTLQSDISNILRKEPHWELFANDFKVVDQTGAELDGLEQSKLLFRRLRRICQRFTVTDDIRVQLTQVVTGFEFVARWNVRFGRFRHDLKTQFYFNDKSQVRLLLIQKWFVNGQRFQLPIKDWAGDFRELKPLETDADASLQNKVPEARLGFEKVVDILQSDISNILREEPHWALFAEDFQVIDQTGASLNGLDSSRLLLRRLRRICQKFTVKDDIQVQYTQVIAGFELVARWNVRFGRFRHQLKTTFYFNDVNQVQRLQIDKWFVNGNWFQMPITTWASSIKDLQPSNHIEDDSAPSKDAIENDISANLVLDNGKSVYKSELPDFDKVVDTLQSEIPNILRAEPRWNMFAEDLTMTDQTGARLEGLEANKRLLSKLRVLFQDFALNDEITVQCIQAVTDFLLVFRWEVKLSGLELPFLPHADMPATIKATTTFHFNGKNEVDLVRIDRWRVNGEQLQLPIERWAQDFREKGDFEIYLG